MAVRTLLALALGASSGVEGMRRASKAQCGSQGVAAASNGTGSQIVNGDQAEQCVWKWQASFRSTLTLGWPYCGGTIIAPQWVLTAAHCNSRAGFQVTAGDWNAFWWSGNEQHRRAAEWIPHPNYNSRSFTHDIALIKLDRPFDFNDCVGAACLPTGSDIPPGSKCFITGWGTLSSGGIQPRYLQQGEVTIRANNDCGSYPASQIDESMICAQGARADNGNIVDACQGDSGGPLVCEVDGVWGAYGATSWGRGCAREGFPGVWSRANFVIDWINSVLAG